MRYLTLILLFLPLTASADLKATPKVIMALKNASEKAAVPYRLIAAICFVESSFRPHVIHKDDGNADSVGLCQVQLVTAQEMGFEGTVKELLNPYTNALYAAKYLKFQLVRYDGDWFRAIAAYNKGNSKQHIENRTYVQRVVKAAIEL
jgi:soluble lytic murein transglycosylase-like protein